MLARRRAIDYARKEGRRPQIEPLTGAEFLPEASGEPAVFIRGESDDVVAAIRDLPEETRRIFFLHFDEGMTRPQALLWFRFGIRCLSAILGLL